MQFNFDRDRYQRVLFNSLDFVIKGCKSLTAKDLKVDVMIKRHKSYSQLSVIVEDVRDKDNSDIIRKLLNSVLFQKQMLASKSNSEYMNLILSKMICKKIGGDLLYDQNSLTKQRATHSLGRIKFSFDVIDELEEHEEIQKKDFSIKVIKTDKQDYNN